MRWTYDRGIRPGEKIDLPLDFSGDVAVVPGDSGLTFSPTVATIDDPGTDLTATCLANATFNAGTGLAQVTLKGFQAQVGKTYAVKFDLETAAARHYTHDVLVLCKADV